MQKDTSMAKFVFLYLLSLLALVFLTISAGNIMFQIINKYFPEITAYYASGYSLSALRFALSSLIVAAPVYFVSMWQINKNLAAGAFDKDNPVRKWLTYFILLVAAVIMIGDLIFVINSFLEGELTIKFALKTLTVLVLAGTVFGYYLYDIRRETMNAKDVVIHAFRYGAIVAALIIFIAGIFFVESPQVAREKRQDQEVVQQLVQLENAVQNYYTTEEALPENLDQLAEEVDFIIPRDLNNIVTGSAIEYEVLNETEYRLCTEFQRSTMDDTEQSRYDYYNKAWLHEAGRDCFEREAQDVNTGMPPVIR